MNETDRSPAGLLFFHVFTGCDCVFSLNNVGKLTAWDVWKAFSQIKDVFVHLPQAYSPHV